MWLKRNVSPHKNNVNSCAPPVYSKLVPCSVKKIPVWKNRPSGRNTEIIKLKEMGITGKIWTWIKDFLTGRTATINMNGFKGKKFSSYLGLPQGSVIAALLFILFIADWYLKVKSEKVKFADDGTTRAEQKVRRIC